MNSPQIIPFGKYKGKPVEVLQQDHDYAQWLMAQPWFRERFQPTYNLIVNNFGEPSETPEHNALQALFLDDRFCVAFVLAVLDAIDGSGALERIRAKTRHTIEVLAAEFSTRAAVCERASREADAQVFERGHRAKAEAARLRAAALLGWVRSDNWQVRVRGKRFEEKGIDVTFVLESRLADRPECPMPQVRDGEGPDWHSVYSGSEVTQLIEIKPVLADDYPAVLRQMRSSGCTTLFTTEYVGEGATLDQVRRMFSTAGIVLLLRSDVDVGRVREAVS